VIRTLGHMTFGTGGVTRVDVGSNYDVIRSIVVQADGRILRPGRRRRAGATGRR